MPCVLLVALLAFAGTAAGSSGLHMDVAVAARGSWLDLEVSLSGGHSGWMVVWFDPKYGATVTSLPPGAEQGVTGGWAYAAFPEFAGACGFAYRLPQPAGDIIFLPGDSLPILPAAFAGSAKLVFAGGGTARLGPDGEVPYARLPAVTHILFEGEPPAVMEVAGEGLVVHLAAGPGAGTASDLEAMVNTALSGLSARHGPPVLDVARVAASSPAELEEGLRRAWLGVIGTGRGIPPGPTERVVYLTFDDGPSATVTPMVLDILAAEQVPATFFVIGVRAQARPELIRRMLDEGHAVPTIHTATTTPRSMSAPRPS